MKILYITTIGGTMVFFNSLIGELRKEGHVVDIATNETDSRVPDYYREIGCKVFQISTSRSPFSFGNIKAISEIRKIAKDCDIVHCHTPLASMATRLACRKLRKKGLKVMYTAHGFHFYKGAPIKNWLLYYPIEWFCSYFTDVLITITKEDYSLAKKRLKAKQTEYVPGVGIDYEKFNSVKVKKNKLREELNLPKDATVLLSVGELNKNKNHQIVIKALSKIDNDNIHYIIVGKGNEKDNLENLAKELGIDNQVHLLGYRNDVEKLYKISDIYVLPSIREGLNVSIMEAMASGLPVICSFNRGNNDFVSYGVLGCDLKKEESDFKEKIEELTKSYFLRIKMGEQNIVKSREYIKERINKTMLDTYLNI